MKVDRGLTAAVLAPFFIALSIMLTKIAGTTARPLVIAGLGSLMSVPLLLIVRAFSKSPLELHRLMGDLRVPFIKVVLTRAIIGQALIVSGFTLTTGVKAILLLRLEPLFVLVWGALRHKEVPQPKKLALVALLLAGCAMVVAPRGQLGGPNWGDALVVTSLLFLSYSYLPTEEIVSKSSPAGLNIASNFVGGIAITVIALFWYTPASFALPVNSYLFVAAYSFVFFVIAASLYFYAFKTLKPWVIASFLSLEVIFGLGLAAVMLHESMSILQCMGATIVLIATVAIGRLGHD